MHPALAGVGLCAVGGGGLVDHSLLHDCAVHGEAVRGGSLGVGGGGGSDEGFQDGALRSPLVSLRYDLRIWVDVDVDAEMEMAVDVDVGMGAYNDGRVPFADFLVLVFGGILQCGVAGLSSCEFEGFTLAGAAGHTSVVILINSGTGRG